MTETLVAGDAAAPDARTRILDSAYELFSQRGVRAVGVDEVIEHASVAKATLYSRRRAETAEEQLLAIFDLFDEWFRQPDFEGCSFVNVLLETADREHPVGRASAAHLAAIRDILRSLAEEAGLRDPEAFAHRGTSS